MNFIVGTEVYNFWQRLRLHTKMYMEKYHRLITYSISTFNERR